ncbi:unnamed protein product [Amaranthus hypochondriacus]
MVVLIRWLLRMTLMVVYDCFRGESILHWRLLRMTLPHTHHMRWWSVSIRIRAPACSLHCYFSWHWRRWAMFVFPPLLGWDLRHLRWRWSPTFLLLRRRLLLLIKHLIIIINS